MDDQPRIAFYTRTLLFIRRFRLWFLLLAFVLWSLGFYALGRTAVYYENPGLAEQQQAAKTLKKVGQLIQLPANETPSMATINDADSVKKEQPFLANAKNGDVIIVYASAQTALLYRPSEDKLIAVGPVTSAPTAGQSARQPVTTITNETTATSTKK
jgi:hypothetical protein